MKSIKAWAVVNKKKPVLNPLEIFSSKNDVVLSEEEKFIQVEIKTLEK